MAPGASSPTTSAASAPVDPALDDRASVDDPGAPPGGTGPGGPWPRRTWAVVLGVCTVAAIAALAVPVSLAYDPWAWLVWGREVVHLDLDTTGGPSWKPLPLLVATPVTLAGDLAPELWLVLARVGSLLALVGVFRLAARLAAPGPGPGPDREGGTGTGRRPGVVAGLLAAGLFVLTPDGGPRYTRLLLEGHSAPVTAALAVWSIERHLAGRHGTAVGLLALLALDRPEAWPFLGLYALWLGRREPERRLLLAALLVAVPVLWFGGDWWGSGSPLHGADTAQVYADDPDRLGKALGNVRNLVILPVWVLALAGAAVARRRGRHRDRRRRDVAALVALAAAWLALVVGMSAALGYAAIPRFMLPSAALLCVAAAVAAAALARAVPTDRRAVGVALGLAVSLPFVVSRASAFGALLTDVTDRGRAGEDLVAAVRQAGGLDRLVACPGPLRMSGTTLPRPALAWEAGVPLHDVVALGRRPAGVVLATAGSRADERLAAQVEAGGTDDDGGGTGADDRPVLLARHGGWAVYAVGCPAPAGP
ncbi:MAG TPA: hypothetical protein VIL36_15210 [Acidimicrobiales bacterium]